MKVYKTLLLHVAYPLIEVEVLNTSCVKRGRAAQKTVYLITFFDEKFCQV